MAKKPGRLHRKLSPDGSPLFSLTAGGTTFNDDSIISITTHRGAAQAETSIAPSTMEFRVPGAPNILRDSDIRLRLTTAAAAKFAVNTGILTSGITDRFNGRKGTTSVEDKAWKTGSTAADFNSTLVASSWTSVLRNRRSKFTATAGASQFAPLLAAFTNSNVNTRQPIEYSGAESSYSDTVAVTETDLTFSDVVTKYGTDLGVLFQHRRNGTVNIQSPRWRNYLLSLRATSRWPILRSQGISPAQWEQPIEAASEQFVLTRRTSTGTLYTQTWPLPASASPVMLETTDIDLTQIIPRTTNYEYVMNGLNHRTNGRRMALNSLTVDMIMLLSSTKPVDRRIAAQLLELEHGDPIYFSGDWPQAIRGSYFASQITENIDSETWEMVIDLSHPRDVLGLIDGEIPQAPPRVWDQFVTTWDETPLTWNDY